MTNPTATIQKFLDEIERLDREATRGPWQVNKGEDSSIVSIRGGNFEASVIWGIAGDEELIAHYRTAAPRMGKALKHLLILVEDFAYSENCRVLSAYDYKEIARILEGE